MTARERSARPLLSRGDTIGVVATGFAVPEAAFERGLARLRRSGYRVRVGSSALARHGYLAGSDDARLADLSELTRDPEVRAIWFARGGYGTARLLDRAEGVQTYNQPSLMQKMGECHVGLRQWSEARARAPLVGLIRRGLCPE